MRYRATVAYDGSAYHGFQRQREGIPTVQFAIEEAFPQIGQGTVQVLAAGRTDAGVHAVGQVIAFRLPDWRHGPEVLQRALNAVLPTDIAVWVLEEAHPEFHPRFDALSRTYRYEIHSAQVRHPLERLRAWHVRSPLDLTVMQKASMMLVGEHDFGTFGTPPQGEGTFRIVYRAEWETYSDKLGEGIFYDFVIEANAFLYRMVRSLVGTLCDVGGGRMSVGAFQDRFESCDRSLSSAAAPAHGLTLISVNY